MLVKGERSDKVNARRAYNEQLLLRAVKSELRLERWPNGLLTGYIIPFRVVSLPAPASVNIYMHRARAFQTISHSTVR